VRHILQVCTQMKRTLIPPELALNREAIMKLMAGEQRKRSADGHRTPPRCSPEQHGSRWTRFVILGDHRDPGVSVYPCGIGDNHACHIARRMPHVVRRNKADHRICSSALAERLPRKSTGHDATYQVQAGTSSEVLHNFETCQKRWHTV